MLALPIVMYITSFNNQDFSVLGTRAAVPQENCKSPCISTWHIGLMIVTQEHCEPAASAERKQYWIRTLDTKLPLFHCGIVYLFYILIAEGLDRFVS